MLGFEPMTLRMCAMVAHVAKQSRQRSAPRCAGARQQTLVVNCLQNQGVAKTTPAAPHSQRLVADYRRMPETVHVECIDEEGSVREIDNEGISKHATSD